VTAAAPKPGRGGRRAGAGRPALPGATEVRVLLGPEHLALASALGAGTISAGIRRALELAAANPAATAAPETPNAPRGTS
jgi:hypothetical protein